MILEKPDFTHPLLRKGWGTRSKELFFFCTERHE
jgi:hypothetical protein